MQNVIPKRKTSAQKNHPVARNRVLTEPTCKTVLQLVKYSRLKPIIFQPPAPERSSTLMIQSSRETIDMSLSAGMSPIGVIPVYMRIKLVLIGGQDLSI